MYIKYRSDTWNINDAPEKRALSASELDSGVISTACGRNLIFRGGHSRESGSDDEWTPAQIEETIARIANDKELKRK